MRVKEVFSKTILTKTGIEGYDYCINPYVGCEHGCRYCYASFMKRFTGHTEPWGEFVDVKINAPAVLSRQSKRVRKGSILFGTVTDPYQPVEQKYMITRNCLEVLVDCDFSINLLTRSSLVTRDIDLIGRFAHIEIGMSITTDDENVKRNFESHSPSISSRVEALKKIHRAGVHTYAFLGPMLPMNTQNIVDMLSGAVDSVLIDRLNYPKKVFSLYRGLGLERYLRQDYFLETGMELKQKFESRGISADILFSG